MNSNSLNNKKSLSQQDGCDDHTRREKPARAYNSNTMPQALPAGGVFHKGVELFFSGVLFKLVHFFLKAFKVLLSFAICLSISIELRFFFVYIGNLRRVLLSLKVCM